MSEQRRRDVAHGILMGALVGDAAGATLEFLGRAPTGSEVEHCFRMPGGGAHAVAPGQVTDDGELMICLARGLVTEVTPRIEAVASSYVRWIESNPFDVGITTRNALWMVEPEDVTAGRAAAKARESALQRNMGSKANGSLMRCMPLAVYGWRWTAPELAAAARADSMLTHPNPACQDAVAAYVIALASLVAAREPAFEAAHGWARENACEEVREWMDDAARGELPSCHPQDGFAKIAFVHAMHHLRTGTAHREALRAVLIGGGDTDTNACIVGGAAGAVAGLSRLEGAMVDKVLGCDTRHGQPRPDWLHPRFVPELADQLLALAPPSSSGFS